ncbi:unnamed protein product [Litomosoides sigmodontis]|uniref:Uncharacterized protein n=1 Tax=Litomosoides sigmodontis TaxID=42156 RepID=A0A3P6T1D0_LITSI|nr:unnamed protein product [Litomosoides sigmodontis]
MVAEKTENNHLKRYQNHKTAQTLLHCIVRDEVSKPQERYPGSSNALIPLNKTWKKKLPAENQKSTHEPYGVQKIKNGKVLDSLPTMRAKCLKSAVAGQTSSVMSHKFLNTAGSTIAIPPSNAREISSIGGNIQYGIPAEELMDEEYVRQLAENTLPESVGVGIFPNLEYCRGSWKSV